MTEHSTSHQPLTETRLGKPAHYDFVSEVEAQLQTEQEPFTTEALGISWFQERGLMRPLVLNFSGDPKQALQAVYESNILTPTEEPAIHSNAVVALSTLLDENETFRTQFEERVEEIERAIELTEPRLSKKLQHAENQIAHARELERTYPQTTDNYYGKARRGRKNKTLRNILGNAAGIKRKLGRAERERDKNYDTSLTADVAGIIDTTIKPQDRVVCLLPDPNDITQLAFVMARLQRQSKVYVAGRHPDIKVHLFEKLMAFFTDGAEMKGLSLSGDQNGRRKQYQALNGQSLLPDSFRQQMADFFSQKFKEKRWYEQAYELDRSFLPDEFFVHWNIMPGNLKAQEALMAVPPGSVDVVIADHLLNKVDPDKVSEILIAAHRALRKGGRIVFSEDPFEQAVAEYYSYALFGNQYKRVAPHSMRHPAKWMVFEKTAVDTSSGFSVDPHDAFTFDIVGSSNADKTKKQRIDSSELGSWDKLEEAQEGEVDIEVVCGEFAKKSGVFIQFGGIVGVIPQGQLNENARSNPESLTGQKITVRIVEVDRTQNRLIASQIIAEGGLTRQELEEKLDTFHEGEIRKATVTGFSNYGVFCEINGVNGLIHIAQISWERVSDPNQQFTIGQEVDVSVMGKNRTGSGLDLSIKRLLPDPWETIETDYAVGSPVTGEVVEHREYGYIIRFAPGIEGLLYKDNLPDNIVIPVGTTVVGSIEKLVIPKRHLGMVLTEIPSQIESYSEEKIVAETLDSAAAHDEETESTEITIFSSDHKPLRPKKGEQESYTIADIAKKEGVSEVEVKRRLKELGIDSNLIGKGRGRSASSVRRSKKQFSYEEMRLITSGLHKKE